MIGTRGTPLVNTPGRSAPGLSEVNEVITRLKSNTAFLIAVVVANNPADVRARYELITGKAAPANLASALNAMVRKGQQDQVKKIMAVPWRWGSQNSALDTAVRSLKNEAMGLMNQPGLGIAKMGPVDNNLDLPDPGTSSAGTTGAASGNDGGWVQDTTAILGSLTGLIDVLNGGGQPTAGSGGTVPAEPQTNWPKVILTVVAIAVAITVVAIIIKAVRK